MVVESSLVDLVWLDEASSCNLGTGIYRSPFTVGRVFFTEISLTKENLSVMRAGVKAIYNLEHVYCSVIVTMDME